MKFRIAALLVPISLLFSCGNSANPNLDGKITVNVSGLDTLTGYNAGSDIWIEIYEPGKSGSLLKMYIVTDPGTASVGLTLGVPEEIFPGGYYDLDIVVQIDGNENKNTGIDYWLSDYFNFLVDGNITLDFTETNFTLIGP